MKKRIMLTLVCLLAAIGWVAAQNSPITGIVISAEDNEPIIGASVLVKGSTTGAVIGKRKHYRSRNGFRRQIHYYRCARRCENPASVFRRYDNTRSSHHSGDDKSHIKE